MHPHFYTAYFHTHIFSVNFYTHDFSAYLYTHIFNIILYPQLFSFLLQTHYHTIFYNLHISSFFHNNTFSVYQYIRIFQATLILIPQFTSYTHISPTYHYTHIFQANSINLQPQFLSKPLCTHFQLFFYYISYQLVLILTVFSLLLCSHLPICTAYLYTHIS